jgi:hypothetical protein
MTHRPLDSPLMRAAARPALWTRRAQASSRWLIELQGALQHAAQGRPHAASEDLQDPVLMLSQARRAVCVGPLLQLLALLLDVSASRHCSPSSGLASGWCHPEVDSPWPGSFPPPSPAQIAQLCSKASHLELLTKPENTPRRAVTASTCS